MSNQKINVTISLSYEIDGNVENRKNADKLYSEFTKRFEETFDCKVNHTYIHTESSKPEQKLAPKG